MADYHVRVLPNNKLITLSDEQNLLSALAAAGMPLQASCGGRGTCGQCRVIIKEGQVCSTEAGTISQEEQRRGYVLACQSRPASDLAVEVPAGTKLGEHRVLLGEEQEARGARHGEDAEAFILYGDNSYPAVERPVYRKIRLKIPQPTLDDPADDCGRLTRATRGETGIERLSVSLNVLRDLPRVLRDAGWDVSVALAEKDTWQGVEIAGVEPYSSGQKYYGLAVDIGTTTVAAELVDLETGRTGGAGGTFNRQSVYGDDVISRIIHTEENPGGLAELQKAILETVNDLIKDLAEGLGIEQADIRAVVCAGNTAMTHFFLGIDPAYIRLEPYTPAANNIPVVQAGQAGLHIHPQAWVRFIPGTASYVGGDITAGVLATGMSEADTLTLFIDIGTNGEMVLGNNEWLISCACSAGPAFEGGGLRYGMRAMDGAIENVRIAAGGSTIRYSTIGGGAPLGICGTGLIDCVAWLYRSGVIDRGGSFAPHTPSPRVRDAGVGKEFVLAWSGEAGGGSDISISEAEIKYILRSKAAVYAGIRSMLQMVGLPFEAIERVVIAGGFGRYINIREAINIGLLPDIPVQKYAYIGNSSLKGARLSLLSKAARDAAEKIAGKITYLELSAGNTFMEEFVSALFIPHTDLELFPTAARRK